MKSYYSLSVFQVALRTLEHLEEFVNGISGLVLRTYQIRKEIELIVTLLDIDEDDTELAYIINIKRDQYREGFYEPTTP